MFRLPLEEIVRKSSERLAVAKVERLVEAFHAKDLDTAYGKGSFLQVHGGRCGDSI